MLCVTPLTVCCVLYTHINQLHVIFTVMYNLCIMSIALFLCVKDIVCHLIPITTDYNTADHLLTDNDV